MLAKVSIIGIMGLAFVAAHPLDTAATTTTTSVAPRPMSTGLLGHTPVPSIAREKTTRKSLSASASDRTPVPSIAREKTTRKSLSLGTTAAPAPTRQPRAAQQVATASELFITILNRHNAPLTTAHAHGEGEGAKGDVGPATLGIDDYGIFSIEPGWSGRVGLNVAGFSVNTGDESLIEGSFKDQGYGFIGDINVSYVDGFTVPILCWCNENKNTAGCSKNLFALNECPNPNGQGSCRNPSRGVTGVRHPTPFFAPCFFPKGAYTFDNDNEANSLNGRCPDEHYTCCVGDGCRPEKNKGE